MSETAVVSCIQGLPSCPAHLCCAFAGCPLPCPPAAAAKPSLPAKPWSDIWSLGWGATEATWDFSPPIAETLQQVSGSVCSEVGWLDGHLGAGLGAGRG